MSRLLLSPRHLHAMEQHAASVYPEECCGVLIGRPVEEAEASFLLEKVLPARNGREEGRRSRFHIPPETVLAAHKEARAQKLEVVGYYHSHPDHPAEPSDHDREHAWPGKSYVIISVDDGEPAATRSWRLSEDRRRFEEEALEELSAAVAAGIPRAR